MDSLSFSDQIQTHGCQVWFCIDDDVVTEEESADIYRSLVCLRYAKISIFFLDIFIYTYMEHICMKDFKDLTSRCTCGSTNNVVGVTGVCKLLQSQCSSCFRVNELSY